MPQVPGTDIVIKPELCVTVLAQSPVFRGAEDRGAEPAGRMQLRVLVQGAMLTEHNLAGHLLDIEAELRDFESDLHNVCGMRDGLSSLAVGAWLYGWRGHSCCTSRGRP
jgi:hypothetical protein